MTETINVIDEHTLEVVKTTVETKVYTKDELNLRIAELQTQIADLQVELAQKQTLRDQWS